ncbi:hypothetical protein [Pseudoalteromonas ruthenica]|uniref:hypothetical protein n=1 Tax=Pseudoalteromonas ruthenica TaxID=151081 RepID=UPI00110BB78F|nr:hypothetical protein [Pseudoalteromonas ruthenica]TMO97565.1 hypothetical protein CWC07_13875 [Pseudoalteromonas ruthenica]
MANLSELEKQELNKVLSAAVRIRDRLNVNADSINDVIFGQVEVVSSDESESAVVKEFMDFIKASERDLSTIAEQSELLKQHFIG